MVERLFLAVPRLQFEIVVFPDHTHLLFLVRLPQFPIIVTSSYTVRLFLQFHLFIYSISSVFVVLCLTLSGVSMMYFQNWFLSQVNGNLIRDSVIL